VEFFNLPNLTNFTNPVARCRMRWDWNQSDPARQPFTAAAAGSFGSMNSTVERTVGLGTNRQIQFAMRLMF